METPKEQALRYMLMAALGGGTLGAAGALISNMPKKRKSLTDLGTKSPELLNIPVGEKLAEEGSFLAGDKAKAWWQVPWAPIGMVGAGIGGLYGANALVSNLRKRHRKRDIQDQIDQAEQEYRSALAESMAASHPKATKLATVKEIHEGLEKLASILKIAGDNKVGDMWDNVPVSPIDYSHNASLKSSLPWQYKSPIGAVDQGMRAARDVVANELDLPKNPAQEWGGALAGLAGLAAVGVPVASGLAAYHYFKNRRKDKLVEEAARARAGSRMQSDLPEFYAQAG